MYPINENSYTAIGVAMGCAGCAMHKDPRRSEGPLAARISYSFLSKGVLGAHQRNSA